MAANLPVTVQTSIDFLKAEGVIASDGHQIASECHRLPQGRSFSFEPRRPITPDGVSDCV
jgi:hypothetical protein